VWFEFKFCFEFKTLFGVEIEKRKEIGKVTQDPKPNKPEPSPTLSPRPTPEPSPVRLHLSLPLSPGRPSSPPHSSLLPRAAHTPSACQRPAPTQAQRSPALTACSRAPLVRPPLTPGPHARCPLSPTPGPHPSAAPFLPFLPPRRETAPPRSPARTPGSLSRCAPPQSPPGLFKRPSRTPPAPYLAHSSTPESPAPPHPSARLAAAGKHRHCNFLAAGNHKASLTPRHRCRTAANLPRWISSTGSSFLDPGHELRHAIAVVPRRRAAASRLRPPRPPVSTARTP